MPTPAQLPIKNRRPRATFPCVPLGGLAVSITANRAALSVISGQTLHGLFTVTLWFLIGGLIVAVLALLSGPYRWAVAFRSWGRRWPATPAATPRSAGAGGT